jgi:hypothetical protein
VKLLGQIASWISSPCGSGLPIYLLDGIAGIGKSTVAQTVAKRAAEHGCLGVSFFFSSNKDQRKSFFGNIAFQLSQYNREFATKIDTALERTPDAANKTLQDQLQKLIVDPLQGALKSNMRTVLIVIDALDECEERDAREILTLLVKEIHRLPFFKIFITTRPESHIRNVLRVQANHELFHLHEIEDSIVEADIRLYLSHRLSGKMVQEALPDLEPPPWEPCAKDMEALVHTAGKLFIIAWTAILFILDDKRYNPQSQVEKLLQGVASDYLGRRIDALDDVYIQILRSAIPENSIEIVEHFRLVVGTIVLLQDPLPFQSLANLLDMPPLDITATLNHLHSIIAPSSQDQSPRIYHKSFPDFITDV